MDVDFAPTPDGSPQAEHILATGSARVNVHTIYAKTPPEDTTVQGDQLFATLVDGEVLSNLRGTGHTSLVTVSPDGVTHDGARATTCCSPSFPLIRRRRKESPITPRRSRPPSYSLRCSWETLPWFSKALPTPRGKLRQ